MTLSASPGSFSLHPLLFDPAYWSDRIAQMADVPQRLLLFPRPDLGDPGIEVTEMLLRAHDGERLRALLGKPTFTLSPLTLRLRLVPRGQPEELDAGTLQAGNADLLLQPDKGRRLEDRVLDVLRVLVCAASLDGLDTRRVDLFSGNGEATCDELRIAERLLAAGISLGGPARAPRSGRFPSPNGTNGSHGANGAL